jgi:Ca-activated chloride channel homolog
MASISFTLTRLAVLLGIALLTVLKASAETPSDRTLSPYFWVKPTHIGPDGPPRGEADVLPLKATDVRVTVTGVFADVKVTQRYRNAGSVPLEAVYVFPGSTRAAVHGLTLQVGDRKIEAKTKERGEARRTYETAKAAGQTASLLEQQRPNVFQMNVANILPGDDISVELRYTELLVPERGTYQFVYPGVVGPRYSKTPEETAQPDQKWVANPYLRKGDADPATFSLQVELMPGMPIADVLCRTHSADVRYEETSRARIAMADAQGANRDFILDFRLAGAAVQSGLLLAEGETENFFLLTVQPPERPQLALAPPREYVFIVDVSGSMNGFPLKTAKTLMRDLLSTLRPQDTFNLMLFSGGNAVLSPTSLPANTSTLTSAMQMLDDETGGGGTELLPALRRALALPADEARSRSFVVITDGYVDIESEAFQLVRENLGRANLFAFGIGSSVNRHLIEGLARAGQGIPFVVTDAESAPSTAKTFAQYVSHPVLTRVKAAFEGFDVYDVEPLAIPDLLAERPLVVFGKWRGSAQGSIVISGVSGEAAYRSSHDVGSAQRLTDAGGLSRLWARSRIAQLSDFGAVANAEEVKPLITELGLKYNLLTRYTSFVAVDEVVRRVGSDVKTVKQPLPLPANVEETAVGGGIGAAPEPSTYALLAAGLVVVALVIRRKGGREV